MSEFNTIDLMNYAVYGNDSDPEWAEIRKYIETNAQARKEFEEIKKNLPQSKRPGQGRERSNFLSSNSLENTQGDSSKTDDSGKEKKGWFGFF